MSRNVKPRPMTAAAAALDQEHKAAQNNLRGLRGQGGKNLAFGFRVSDARELIDSVALGCGIAALLGQVLRNPKRRAAILEEGEEIYARMRSVSRHASAETLLYLDPAVAEGLSIALAGMGLKASARQAGWATFRGPAAIEIVHEFSAEAGVSESAFRLRDLEPFVPAMDDEIEAADERDAVHDQAGDDATQQETVDRRTALDSPDQYLHRDDEEAVTTGEENLMSDATSILDGKPTPPQLPPLLPLLRTRPEIARMLLNLSAPPTSSRPPQPGSSAQTPHAASLDAGSSEARISDHHEDRADSPPPIGAGEAWTKSVGS